jgi:cysteine desulfurase
MRVDELGVDLLTVAGHKLYAPKGIGALYIRSGVPLGRWLHGAGQERGLRPGTENVLEIVGLGEAAALARSRESRESVHLQRLRDHLQSGLQEALPDGRPWTSEERLPITPWHGVPGLSNRLLAELRAASAGAVCHADIEDLICARSYGNLWLARGTCASRSDAAQRRKRSTSADRNCRAYSTHPLT